MTRQIEVIRIFDASVETVWQVWVDPELVKRCRGLKHFTSPVAKMDFREGGKSIVRIKGPEERNRTLCVAEKCFATNNYTG